MFDPQPLDRSLARARAWLAGKDPKEPLGSLVYLSSKEGQTLLNRFKLPLANEYIETLVRKTLNLSSKEPLKEVHLKEAVVSALIHPLRQVIGSCFATAPAIYIQNEKPDHLLCDLYDLLTTAKMKRTFEGREYVIPISPKWGNRQGEHPLLRVWEYTIASFSDYKKTFSQWNLFSSLGLDPKEEGGIGEFLSKALQKNAEKSNRDLEALDQTYREALDAARLSEALLQRADSLEKARTRRAELEVQVHRAKMCREIRDAAVDRSQGLFDLFPFLIEQYSSLFQEHFVEIFDPEICVQNGSLYADSPAGFRLVYKHGRKDPQAWTFLQNEKDFFNSLRHFFLLVEPHLLAVCPWEGGKKEIEGLTTELIHFIETRSFQAVALKKKKPWSYPSGGSLHTLLKGYFMIEGKVGEEKRIVTSPLDLLTFILDVLKALPHSTTKSFEENPNASLLMYSPTHAFLLKPGLFPFKEGWLDRGFTYTWIRDQIIVPAKAHYASIEVDPSTQTRFTSHFTQEAFGFNRSALSIPEFRALLLKKVPHLEEEVDSALYRAFSIHPPLIFADTNWVESIFAFAVNPATLELDLYRGAADSKKMRPMNVWRPYLTEANSKHWGILTRPEEYGGSPLLTLSTKLKKV